MNRLLGPPTANGRGVEVYTLIIEYIARVKELAIHLLGLDLNHLDRDDKDIKSKSFLTFLYEVRRKFVKMKISLFLNDVTLSPLSPV